MAPAFSDASRSFRARMRPSSTISDVRGKSHRRLFARGHGMVSFMAPTPTPVEEEDTGRRSFLAKPPAPGAARRVLSVLRDPKKGTMKRPARLGNASLTGSGYDEPDTLPVIAEEDAVSVESNDDKMEEKVEESTRKPTGSDEHGSAKSDTVSSSSHSANVGARQVMVEVEASEVSDDVTSSAGRSARSRIGSSSAPSAGQNSTVQDADDLLFIDDCETANIAFNYVGDEEDDVPEAPTSYSKSTGAERVWATMEDRVHALQAELDKVRGEKATMEAALQEQNRELGVLLESMRLRAAESSAEVEDLTRQLKDTKRRLARRVRELEEEAAAQKLQHAEEIARYRSADAHLRAELEVIRGANQKFAKIESSPAVPVRRQRASVQHALLQNHSIEAVPVPWTAALEPVSGGGHSRSNQAFVRTRSAGNVHESVRRKNSRHDGPLSATRPRSVWVGPKPSSSTPEITGSSPRTAARRSLVRRGLIAHIHSSKYKSARAAWQGFFGADTGQVSPEQFARAVRALAIAADARDRDLEMLRDEVCGAETCDTGVMTWGMFARFYQRTRNEAI